MADEQYRWLNRDAAERLLRGEPLEAVDADTRARADRLAEALEALAAEVEPVSSQTPELPGEEAALAAFRTARTARTARPVSTARSGEHGQTGESGRGSRTHTASAPAADGGLVRLGRPVCPPAGSDGRRARWGRPVRFGLVAAVAAGMLGGVTAVAGGGALSSFRDDEPEPSATISAGQSPDRPLLSPSPNTEKGDGRREAWGGETPEASPDPSAKGDAPSGKGTGGTGEDGQPGDTGQDEGLTREQWNSVLSACRDIRDGRNPDADRRRGLEDAAGGKGKGELKRYCEGVLAGSLGNPGNAKRPGGGAGTGKGTGAGASGSGDSGGGAKNPRSGNDSDEDDDSDHGKGRHGNGKGNGNGKNRHGNGKGYGNGSWNGTGKNKGGKNKSGKGGKGNTGGKGNGGNGHRGQLSAVTPIDFVVRVTPS